MKILGISGTIVGAKTAIIVQEVLDEIEKIHPKAETELLDLRDYDVQFCDGRNPVEYTGETKEVIDIINSADCFIIGTPIFQGSITGVLKNLFDLVPISTFRKKVMGFVGTGGTYQHVVIENQLKPIAGFFRSFVAPSYVYVHSEDFNEQNEISHPDSLRRIESLAQEVVQLQKVNKEQNNYRVLK